MTPAVRSSFRFVFGRRWKFSPLSPSSIRLVFLVRLCSSVEIDKMTILRWIYYLLLLAPPTLFLACQISDRVLNKCLFRELVWLTKRTLLLLPGR